MGIAAAGIGAAAVSAGVGAVASSSAASKEAGATKSAAAAANNAQTANLQQTTMLNAPAVAVGNNALTDIADASGSNGLAGQAYASSLFQTDPGYQFDLTQGEKAVDNGAAARGLVTSGANIKGETDYAEGVADNAYSSWYNRLSSLANLGQNAIASDANAGAGAANNISQTDTSAASAENSTTTAGTNALTGALNGFLNNATVQNALTTYASPTKTTMPQVGGLY